MLLVIELDLEVLVVVVLATERDAGMAAIVDMVVADIQTAIDLCNSITNENRAEAIGYVQSGDMRPPRPPQASPGRPPTRQQPFWWPYVFRGQVANGLSPLLISHGVAEVNDCLHVCGIHVHDCSHSSTSLSS